jgi:hypothetical protein
MYTRFYDKLAKIELRRELQMKSIISCSLMFVAIVLSATNGFTENAISEEAKA